MPSSDALLFLLFFLLAVIIDLMLVARWRKKRAGQQGGQPAPGSALRGIVTLFERAVLRAGEVPWGALGELALIVLWVYWVSSPLLATPATAVPRGGEFSNLTQTHFIWTLLPKCGLCFLWNGSINGGAPAFAELTGAVLHPLVFIPVLLWGVIQGSKVTFAASLALAGMAQWALARKLGLGWWARMWSAFLIVVGGHLSGKMENADVGLVLGQACAALALTAGVDLLFNRNRRAVAWLAGALCLTLLSGEGYIQLAVALAMLPALGLLCLGRAKERTPDGAPSSGAPAWKDFLLAIGLAALLGAIFLVPLLHFLPQVGKEADTSLSNYPPLEYIPLNLVIRDLKFLRMPILGKDPYLATHVIYIGWAPVLLALLGLRFFPARLSRLLWSFWTGILLVFLITSLDLPRALIKPLPIVGTLRHLTVASGLAVPYIVALAAISLDEILRLGSAVLRARLPERALPEITAGIPGALGMIPFAILSIYPCYTLSQNFLGVRDIDYLGGQMQVLQTASAQWIQPPYGFYDWTSTALELGMKIGYTYRPWFWKDHDTPKSFIEAVRLRENAPAGTSTPDTNVGSIKTVGEYGFLFHPEAEYASVQEQGKKAASACQATSLGGWIDVDCRNSGPGDLTVRENAWDGWYAWVDGKQVGWLPGPWLEVRAPAGAHHYRFRYLPWDVAVGALLTLVGMGIMVWWLFGPNPRPLPEAGRGAF